MEVSGKLHVTFALPPGNASPSYLLSKAGLRICLDFLEKTEIPFSFVSNHDFQPVAKSTYRLH